MVFDAILKEMALIVHGLRFTVHRSKKTVNCQLLTVNCRQRRQGFGLIEFLIVIAIFGLSVSLITASFLTFERNQRVKNAARQLKSDLRLAQNKASSGDKGIGTGLLCLSTVTPETLVGWYVNMTAGSSSYTIAGDCLKSTGETSFGSKTINLPRGVKLRASTDNPAGITNGIYTPSSANILFQPLTNKTTFLSLAPPFYGNYAQGIFKAGAVLDLTNNLVITLIGEQSGVTYQVTITPSGEINENKP